MEKLYPSERENSPDYDLLLTIIGGIGVGLALWYFCGDQIPSLANSVLRQIGGVAEEIGNGVKFALAFGKNHDVGLKPGINFVDLAQTKGMGDLIKTLYSLVPDGNPVSRFTNDLLQPIK